MQSSDGSATMLEHPVNTGEGPTNALASAASAYLRSARHQPVEWIEWGEAAFDRAMKQDKPILLDIGAVWCHWCHVMDRESYENEATARLINQHFIAIKVDRDERPDVDARYQAAVSSISGQGGWPLTAFLTPDGKPYFGGTYFPPEDRHGRPSFQRVLLTMAEAFANRRTEVDESAASVMSAIEHNEAFSGRADGKIEEISSPLVQKMAISTLQSADLQNGGFGSQPKFPNSSAIDLLIDLATNSNAQVAAATVNMKEQGTVSLAEAARRVARLTLEKMARGGVYDQLAGGFHRYSVDEYWLVPHFEKMAYDNSELLKNYIHAYRAFGDEEFALIARDIIRWIDQCLSDRKLGGFYASQDADVSLDDDGDYFTWTLDEAAEALTAEELAIASCNYDIGEIGQMQHNVAKNVLHRKREIDAVARRAGLTIPEASTLLESAKKKLYAARLERPTPYVDKTIYVAWNALCISAYIEAARALDRADTQAFALKSLDRVLAAAWSGNAQTEGGTQTEAPRSLAHIVAYGEQGKPAELPPAILDDYILLGHATLDAWQTTGEMRYYSTACDLMDAAIDRFYDLIAGGFFDAEKPAEGKRSLGVLGARRKPLQDAPTPAGNPMAAILLLRLHELNGRADYAAKARQTLEAFAGVVEHFSLYAATYALALQRLITPPVQVCIVGNDELARSLEATALAQYAVNKSVVRFTREQITGRSSKKLPPALAETLPHLAKLATSFAVVCSGNTCQPPITTPADLAKALQRSL